VPWVHRQKCITERFVAVEIFWYRVSKLFCSLCEFSGSVTAGVQALSFFPYGATPAQAVELISALGWVQFFWRADLFIIALQCNARIILGTFSAGADGKLKPICDFWFSLVSQSGFYKPSAFGSEFNSNSSALLSSAWRKVYSKRQEKLFQVWCPKSTMELQGHLTKKSRGQH
jgi:hypothetical protein